MSYDASHLGSYPRRAGLLALTHTLALSVALPASICPAAAQVPAAPSVAGPDRKVSLDFVQTDINVVAKALSIQSGVNVVLMPSVKGNVTVRLIKLAVDDALRQTAVAVGSEVRRIGNTYYLGTTTELKSMVASAGIKENVRVKHQPVDDMKKLVQATFPFVTVDSAGQSLILAGTQEDVSSAVAIVRDADLAPPPAPVVRAAPSPMVRETYTAKYAKATSLADTLAKAMPDLKVLHVEKTLVLEGSKDSQTAAAKLLAALDTQGAGERVVRSYELKYVHPHQASATLKPLFPNLTIQAGFESYTPPKAKFSPLSIESAKAFNAESLKEEDSSSSSQAGGGSGGQVNLEGPGSRSRVILLAGPADEVQQATQVIQNLDVAPAQVLIEARVVDIAPEKAKELGFLWNWSSISFFEKGGGDQTDRGTNAGRFLRSPFDLSVTFDALEQSRDAKVLAKPNIAVVDGEEASIFIGDILRYERLESVTAVGQTFTIETVPVGVALLCRPRVNTDGDITLRVHPVVSSVVDFTGRNRDIPITASREAESTIVMRDGETVAIGGLLRDEDIKLMSKVPIVGDLPFIGQLFRHRRTSKKRSEVTIFLTAKLLKK